ncbi:MAG: hypothetical protein KGH57_02705 [Candidatus Micrarchaeota archaeon]|nr:hypothetical protein [Candidatus Micrarchaeota archaeon]
MLGLNLDASDRRQYALIALAYLVASLIIFWPIMAGIASAVPGTGGDIFQSMWELWWVPYSMFTLHATPYYTNYIFYPVGANLATQTLAPIAGLVSMLFQPAGLAFAYNAIFLIGFVLAGLFAYLLAFHVTHHRTASFIAGFIYAFSPIHTVQAFGHLQFTNIEFIPLFLLMLLKLMDERKQVYAFGAGISLVLLTFMGDIEQGLMAVMLAVFVLAYMGIRKSERHKLFNRKFLLMLSEVAGIAFLVGSPFIIGVLSHLNSSILATVNAQGTTTYNELYSPDLLTYFVPSQFNGLLSFISSPFAPLTAPAPAERTAYIGYSVILLALVGLAHEYKEKFAATGVYLVPLVIFGLLSIGPYLQVNGNVTGIPGIYQLYHLIPVFNALREPGRFDMLVELFLAIFAAIGIAELEKKYAASNMKRYIPFVFLALIIVEYNAWPTSSGMLNSMYTLNTTIPRAYHEIGSLTANFSVLVLPALPNYTSQQPELYPGLALYYQTAFKKPLVGGYATRSNTTQSFLLVNMPLAVSAYYLQTHQGLVYGSPLKENYSNVTDFFLGAYNVGFVSIIRQAYNQTELQQLASYLAVNLGYPVYQSNDTIVFSTSNITRTAGTSMLEYTPVLFNNPNSVWQPGWILCGNSQLCNSDYLNTWFGADPAYINLYTPNYTKVNVYMRAFSPFNPKTSYIYLNNQLINELNLSTTPQNYSFTIGLNPGINYMVFVSSSSNRSTYSNIGIENITFLR